VLDVEVEGHESYWLVTRADQPCSGHVRAFHDWLRAELARDDFGTPQLKAS
jgi:LysR family transcriptional regulator, glycine cleavage system transcriptional activator